MASIESVHSEIDTKQRRREADPFSFGHYPTHFSRRARQEYQDRRRKQRGGEDLERKVVAARCIEEKSEKRRATDGATIALRSFRP